MYIFQPDRHLLRKQISEVSKFIKGDVLDIGAGNHDRYSSMFKYKKQYVKMDVHSGPNTDIVGRADAIPQSDEKFDSIVCTQVFEHLEFPEKSVFEIYRVLKKGGHVLITAPQMNELHEEPFDFFRYTNFGLISIFKRAGFSLVHEGARGGFYSTLAQMIIRYCIDRFGLYERKMFGKILGKPILVFGKALMWLDSKDKSLANRKHTIGWIFVFKKD